MIKKLTLSLLLCFLASYAHASDSFSVAPDANSGTPFFSTFQQGSEGQAGTSYNAILPKIIVSYVPSGNIADTLGNNAAGQAPDLGAVQAIVIYLAQVFQQKASAGTTGKLVWSIPMYFIIFGLFLSGFLTWQAVGQGKKGPGEAVISFTTKIVMCIILFQFVCPNIPYMLIGMCDTVTSGIGGWFTPTGQGEQADLKALKSTYKAKMGQSYSSSLLLIASAEKTIWGLSDPNIAQKIVNEINSDPDIMDLIGKGEKDPGWSDILSKKNPGEQSALISSIATGMVVTTQQKINSIVNRNLTSNPNAPTGSTAAADELIKTAIAATPQGINLSSLSYPPKAIAANAYISLCYLGIGIWGLGIASLIWVAFYSMPEDWQLGGVLFSGIKSMVAIVLTCLLISVYIAASCSWSDLSNETAHQYVAKSFESLSKAKPHGSSIGSWWDWVTGPGGIPGKLFGLVNENTFSQLVIGMLIFSAPAQAAAMVKGGNGIGEQASNALHAGGASSQGLAAMWGGHNQGGGSSASAQSGTISMINRQSVAAPSPPP